MTCTFRWCEMTGHFHCRNDPPTPPPAEPTTAEAFATVRACLAASRVEQAWTPRWLEALHAVEALALLERRMQEMEGRA